MKTPRLNTDAFEASHGSKPKGSGLWWFEIFATDGQGSYLTEEHSGSGTLNEAKVQAVRSLKSSCGRVTKIVEIIVLP